MMQGAARRIWKRRKDQGEEQGQREEGEDWAPQTRSADRCSPVLHLNFTLMAMMVMQIVGQLVVSQELACLFEHHGSLGTLKAALSLPIK